MVHKMAAKNRHADTCLWAGVFHCHGPLQSRASLSLLSVTKLWEGCSYFVHMDTKCCSFSPPPWLSTLSRAETVAGQDHHSGILATKGYVALQFNNLLKLLEYREWLLLNVMLGAK